MRPAPNNMPSMKEVGAIKDLLGAFDDIESGANVDRVHQAISNGQAPQYAPGHVHSQADAAAETRAAMTNILGNLGDILDDGPTQVQVDYSPQPSAPKQSMFDIPDEGLSYEEYLAMQQNGGMHMADLTTGQPIKPQLAPAPVRSGPEWHVVSESYKNTKSLKTYSIVHRDTNTPILKDVVMKESVQVILRLLNEGMSIADPRLLGVISMGTQYTRLMEGMLGKMRQRQKVLKESNYQEAANCDSAITDFKAKASRMKADLAEYVSKHSL